MNIIDIIIIIFIVVSGIVGAKRGVFKQLVLCVGLILVFYFAYKFKDPIGDFLLLKGPMFDFPNLFKGVITLNILVYQTVAFLLVFAILLVVFNVILSLTGLFEKLLRITIVLGIPSKILGFLGGLLEGYVIAFIVLFFLTQPAFSFNLFRESKLSDKILISSPLLTDVTSNTVDLIQDIYELKDEKDTVALNNKILDMMLDKKVISYKTANELYQKGKINFDGIENILQNYEDYK